MRHRVSFAVLAVARLTWLLVLSLLAAPALLLRSLFGPTGGPRVLRWYFETCGGGYVKVGQLLATRYDLLRADYTEELGKLLDSLPPVPTAKIIRVIEEELGRPLADVFVVFEPQPIATASLAQVHGAVLADGDDVVVKVLKPGIAERVRIDLAFLRITGRVVEVLPVLRGLDVSGLVEELSRTAIDELDLSREALYTAYLHDRMATDPIAHYAPAVYRHLSSRNILTLERVRGVTVREMLTAITNGDDGALEAWAARGITPERTAVILLRSVLEQTMRLRSFNADPHPSNLIVSDGGTLNWVDFGLMGWIDERQWELQLRLREAIAQTGSTTLASRCSRPWSRCPSGTSAGSSRRSTGLAGLPDRISRPERPACPGLTAVGVRYNRFHTTAVCAPTRQALLAVRNHVSATCSYDPSNVEGAVRA